MKKIILYLRWFFGITIILGSFASIPQNFLVFIPALLMGIIILPPVSNKLTELMRKNEVIKQKKNPENAIKLSKISLLILSFILAVIFSPKDNTTNNKSTEIAKTSKEAVSPTLALTFTKITTIPTLTNIPKPTNKPTEKSPSTPDSNAITLDSLALILVGFDINQSNDRFIGYSKDGNSNITLIGDKNNLKTIMLSLNHMQPNDVLSNSILVQDTLQAVFPTWQGLNTWLGNSLTQFSNSTDPEGDFVETDVNNKHILLGYSPSNSSLNLTITIK